ncbi:MAG: P-II family nitrogen regulator [Chloroflexi bacterium]|nr:P-II family nitrogen regulator [Chloroflexota bacterium]
MKEVVVIIRPEKWQTTREAADKLGLQEVMHRRVLGRGTQGGLRYLRSSSGADEGGMRFLPKRMIVWVVPDEKVSSLVESVVQTNATGNLGDGTIFVCPLESVSIAPTG